MLPRIFVINMKEKTLKRICEKKWVLKVSSAVPVKGVQQNQHNFKKKNRKKLM